MTILMVMTVMKKRILMNLMPVLLVMIMKTANVIRLLIAILINEAKLIWRNCVTPSTTLSYYR